MKREQRAAIGRASSEARWENLCCRFRIHQDGPMLDATIVPSPSQYRKAIKNTLRAFAPLLAELTQEQLMRNSDPCTACSTHFLKFNVARE